MEGARKLNETETENDSASTAAGGDRNGTGTEDYRVSSEAHKRPTSRRRRLPRRVATRSKQSPTPATKARKGDRTPEVRLPPAVMAGSDGSVSCPCKSLNIKHVILACLLRQSECGVRKTIQWPTPHTSFSTNPFHNAAASALVAAGPTGATSVPAAPFCRPRLPPYPAARCPGKPPHGPSLCWMPGFPGCTARRGHAGCSRFEKFKERGGDRRRARCAWACP